MSAFLGGHELPKQAANGQPAAGFMGFGFDASSNFYFIDSSGNVTYAAVPAPAQVDINVSAAASVVLFNGAIGFSALAQKIIAAAGSGAFTAAYGLPTTGMLTGAICEINIELPASANPTVEIHNATAGGTLLTTVADANKPVLGAAAYWYGRFRYDGAAWHCLFRAFNL